jgi:hypothetical protein
MHAKHEAHCTPHDLFQLLLNDNRDILIRLALRKGYSHLLGRVLGQQQVTNMHSPEASALEKVR